MLNSASTAAPIGAAPATPTPLPLPGSGASTAAETGTTGAVPGVHAQTGVVVPLDAFAKQGGPDVSVKTAAGLMRVHAVFQMDPTTRELTVSVVDEAGRLIRMIPSDSVARMIAAMAAYRGR
jgi:hypothetical protein